MMKMGPDCTPKYWWGLVSSVIVIVSLMHSCLCSSKLPDTPVVQASNASMSSKSPPSFNLGNLIDYTHAYYESISSKCTVKAMDILINIRQPNSKPIKKLKLDCSGRIMKDGLLRKLDLRLRKTKNGPPAQLWEIVLTNNNISTIVESTFTEYIVAMRRLDLSVNQFTEIPASLQNLTLLEMLNLSRNSLASVGSGLLKFPLLKHLDLSFNELKLIEPRAFYFVRNLQTLVLAGNKIIQPVSNGFDYLAPLQKLQSLDLSGNGELLNVKTDLSALSVLGALKNLSISRINLGIVSTLCLDELALLERLTLDGNPLNLDSSTFQNLTQLKFLSLRCCKIEHIEDTFQNISNLEGLDLSENLLSTLPENAFVGCDNLKNLILTGNKFKNVPECVSTLKEPLNIDLSKNPLGSISEVEVYFLSRFKNVSFDFQQLPCDCANAPYLKLSLTSQLSASMKQDWSAFCTRDEKVLGGYYIVMILQYFPMLPECGYYMKVEDLGIYMCINVFLQYCIVNEGKIAIQFLGAVAHLSILMLIKVYFKMDIIELIDMIDILSYQFEYCRDLKKLFLLLFCVSTVVYQTMECNKTLDKAYEISFYIFVAFGVGGLQGYIFLYCGRRDMEEETYYWFRQLILLMWGGSTALYSLACFVKLCYDTYSDREMMDSEHCYVVSATVNNGNSEKILNFDMRSDISQIRKQIAQKLKLDPKEKFRLKCKECELQNDEQIFLDFNPLEGICIQVIILHKLSVVYFDGENVQVLFGREDKISRLTTSIAKTLKVPKRYVRLRDYEESRSCGYYGLNGRSFVRIQLKSIHLQLDGGHIVKEYVNITSTLSDYLKTIHPEGYKSLNVRAKHSEASESTSGLDPDTPIYSFVNTNDAISTWILAIPGIIMVHLVFPSLGTKYSTSENHCLVHVDSTIAALKKRLGATHIIFLNTDQPDDSTIAECGITDGAFIFNDRMQMFKVQSVAGKNMEYQLRASSYVRDLKQVLQKAENISLEEQHLSFSGVTLEDDKRLYDYGIQGRHQWINLSKQNLRVMVALPDNQFTSVKLQVGDTVKTLKRTLLDLTKILPEEQRLYFDSQEINDDCILSGLGITSEKPITLKRRIVLHLNEEWRPKTIRWKRKFEDFVQLTEDDFEELEGLYLCTKDPKFRISSGSENTVVYLGLLHDGTEVAIKRYLRSNFLALDNEVDLLLDLDHPRIVRYRTVVHDKSFSYLVLELGEYTLEEFTRELKLTGFLKEKGPKLVREIVEGLEVLHGSQQKILHRDLKPQNVLIDCNGCAKLADFGISKRLNINQSTLVAEAVGTLCWQATETIANPQTAPYRSRTDIQIAGMLMYYILTGGEHPYIHNNNSNPFTVSQNIVTGKHDLSKLSDVIALDLIKWMLEPRPEDRPYGREVLIHPFFWEGENRYKFVLTVGDEKEVKESFRNKAHLVVQGIGNVRLTWPGGATRWHSCMDPGLLSAMTSRRRYGGGVCDLLRFIRNVDVHLKDQPLVLQQTIGSPMAYFMTCLPFDTLFMEMYKVLKTTQNTADDWTMRPSLKDYFYA